MGTGGAAMRSHALLTLGGVALVSWPGVDAGGAGARATGGGSRGSRSYSSPARPAPSPTAPATPTGPAMNQPQRPGLFGGLMGGLAGFALGGLLGSMLFGGGFGGGIGLLEILLVGAGAFFLLRMLRARQSVPQPAYAGSGTSAYTGQGGASGVVVEAPSGPPDVERGFAFIRQMDPGFDPVAFAQWAERAFSDVQDAIARRDLATVADRLTPQEFARLQGQCDQLRGARQTNRVEQIRWRRAEVSEAWQESGQDWVTVYLS